MKQDILLCDLDAFFASVEQLDHPELQGKPVIVGGNPKARGVVSTCSYEAREYGVRSAMPMKKALELCPEAILLPVNMRRYKEVSKQVMTIFERFTPDIEPVSIDEAYLGVKKGTGVETAQQIRAAVKKELKLPISVGISVNKLLAKIASNLAKPDNIKAIWPEDVPDIIWPLPVKIIPGIGSSTEKKCYLYGIKTVGDLAKFPDKALISAFGKNGVIFKNYANGYDNRELELIHKTKSISEETTFPQDVFDREQVLTTLLALSEEVGYRLRSKRLRAKTISLKLRFADFTTISRDITLQEPTDKDLQIYHLVERLFLRHCNKPPWRLVGVRVSGLEKNQQLSLLSSAAENENKIMVVKDRLRDKYGKEVLVSAKRLLKPKE
ncbi:MAG: DNA polymerase IV [Firmicutes bacterium]|nr:DNA polymerase IV [Bacillota bacterium]